MTKLAQPILLSAILLAIGGNAVANGESSADPAAEAGQESAAIPSSDQVLPLDMADQLQQRYERSVDAKILLTPEQIKDYIARKAQEEIASDYGPPPKIKAKTFTVSPGPGYRSPLVTVAPRYWGSIVFVDATGAPWPILHQAAGNPQVLPIAKPEGLEPGNQLQVTAMYRKGYGNVMVTLQGLPDPLEVRLEANHKVATNPVTIRVDRVGPLASPMVMPERVSPTVSPDAEDFLNRVPPAGAEGVTLNGALPGEIMAWRYKGSLWLRTPRHVRWPAAEDVTSQAGIRVYRLPDEPMVIISRDGHDITLQVQNG